MAKYLLYRPEEGTIEIPAYIEYGDGCPDEVSFAKPQNEVAWYDPIALLVPKELKPAIVFENDETILFNAAVEGMHGPVSMLPVYTANKKHYAYVDGSYGGFPMRYRFEIIKRAEEFDILEQISEAIKDLSE